MGEGRTDEPQANHERLTVAQAAAALGITEGAVRGRVKRGTLRSYRESGNVYVLLEGVPESVSSSFRRDESDGPQSDQSRLIAVLREQVAYLQGVIATRDRELETRAQEVRRRDEEIRRRDEALEREQHLAAGFAERLRALGAPSETGQAEETQQDVRPRDASPAAKTQLNEETEEALRGDSRLTSLTPLHYTALPFMVGAGIVAGIANPLLIAYYPTFPSVLYFLWTIPPIFGYWLGRRVAMLRENAWAVANGLATILKLYTGSDTSQDGMDAFNNLMLRFDIAGYLDMQPQTVGEEYNPRDDKSLADIRNKQVAANNRLNVLENLLPVFAVGVSVVTLFSSLGTYWIATDPGEHEALPEMVVMAIVQGVFAALFVLFAAFIVLGRARQKREEAHPPTGDRPRLLSGNIQSLIGLIGTIVTAVFGLIGVLFQVFYGGGSGG